MNLSLKPTSSDIACQMWSRLRQLMLRRGLCAPPYRLPAAFLPYCFSGFAVRVWVMLFRPAASYGERSGQTTREAGGKRVAIGVDHPWTHLRVYRLQEADESLRAWFILGLAAGLVVSRIVNRTGQGVVPHFVSGIVGAVMCGWLFATLGWRVVTGSFLNLPRADLLVVSRASR